jgi:hypothetical protein
MPIKPTVWDPSVKSSNTTLHWDYLTLTTNGARGFVRSQYKVATGKWYAEIQRVSNVDSNPGIVSASESVANYVGQTAQSIGMGSGNVYRNASVVATSAIGTGWIGIAVDATARTVEFFNGSSTTGAVSIPWSGDIYLAGGNDVGSTANMVLNAGQSAFAWTVPSGYAAGFGLSLTLSFSGAVVDETGAPAARVVRAYRRSTGELVGEATSNGTTGAYQIFTPFNEYHTIEFLNDDSALNALVYDWVLPV